MPGSSNDGSGRPALYPNALKAGRNLAPRASGPTFGYPVTPQMNPTYLGILAQSLDDLARYEAPATMRDKSGRSVEVSHESGVQLQPPGPFGGQWRYREVLQGPPTAPTERGAIAMGGRHTEHRHLTVQPGGPVASDDDMRHFQTRLRLYGPFDDATMAITDPSGATRIYGPPTLC